MMECCAIEAQGMCDRACPGGARLGGPNPRLAPFNLSTALKHLPAVLTSLTMALIPLLSLVARRLRAKIEQPKLLDPELAVVPREVKGHAIVVGHGRVGQVVCALLERHRFPFLAIESDPAAVSEYRRRGREVYYGDATDPALLKSCGLMDAAAVIVTINTPAIIDEIVKLVRMLRADIVIVSRARDAAHARASLCGWRDRRRAGDHRGEPAALRGGIG